jgi:restriction system protein
MSTHITGSGNIVAQPGAISGVGSVSPSTVLLESIPLVIQSVISREKETHEGYIMEVVSPAWSEIIQLIHRDPNVVHQIRARQWEELIAGAYDKAGFDEVTLTPHSGDLGQDIIAVKRGWGCIRNIDQVKAYKPGHLVTADDVRALLGVLQADQNATKGIVTTTSDFAPKIREDKFIIPFMPYRLELINGEQLLNQLAKLTKA